MVVWFFFSICMHAYWGLLVLNYFVEILRLSLKNSIKKLGYLNVCLILELRACGYGWLSYKSPKGFHFIISLRNLPQTEHTRPFTCFLVPTPLSRWHSPNGIVYVFSSVRTPIKGRPMCLLKKRDLKKINIKKIKKIMKRNKLVDPIGIWEQHKGPFKE